jgi:hypothetical protein
MKFTSRNFPWHTAGSAHIHTYMQQNPDDLALIYARLSAISCENREKNTETEARLPFSLSIASCQFPLLITILYQFCTTAVLFLQTTAQLKAAERGQDCITYHQAMETGDDGNEARQSPSSGRMYRLYYGNFLATDLLRIKKVLREELRRILRGADPDT